MNKYSHEIGLSQIEGEQRLLNSWSIKLNRLKMLFFLLFSILSVGLLPLIAYWHVPSYRFFLFSYTNLLDCTHFFILNWDGTHTIVRKEEVSYVSKKNIIKITPSGFRNRHLIYRYSKKQKAFLLVEMKTKEALLSGEFSELSENEARDRLKIFGENIIDFSVPSAFVFGIREILNPYFLFQAFSCALWIYEDYILYSVGILVISLLTAIFNLRLARSNLIRLREMAFLGSENSKITVRRNKLDFEISPILLVPGDKFYLREEAKVPCDCLIIQGQVMVNECSLTGESNPVMKTALEDLTLFNAVKSKVNILFEGTSLIQVNSGASNFATAVALKTGFQTTRGQLIRSILYPRPPKVKFFEESLLFLLFMGLITLVGFFAILPNLLETMTAGTIVIKLLDLITISVPPSLPIAINIGIGFSLEKLKKRDIFCISPLKILLGGRVDTICLDKTGTITEETTEVQGFLPSINARFLAKHFTAYSEIEMSSTEQYHVEKGFDCLTVCHSLIPVRKNSGSSTKLFGESLELKMLAFSKATVLNNADESEVFAASRNNNKYKTVKRLEFNSELRRMGVICEVFENEKEGSYYEFFVKGAPETIKTLVNQSTVPADHDEVLKEYAMKGVRILGMASKKIEKLDVSETDREILEKNMTFLGFLLIENKLKPDSIKTIRELKESDLNVKMVTGDNWMTSINVAYECKILSDHEEILFCDVVQNTNETKSLDIKRIPALREGPIEVCSKNILNDDNNKKQHIRLEMLPINENKNGMITSEISSSYEKEGDEILDEFFHKMFFQDLSKTSIAMTGSFFDYFFVKNTIKNRDFFNLLKRVLKKCDVYTRMKPQEKSHLIDRLQKNGNSVAMVGDGANDCGALKQADIGLALSEAEASISAPFTSKSLSISSITTLLRYSRAGLATSFQSFKFLCLYSMVGFASQLILYYNYSSLSDPMFLYIDLIIVIPIFTTMCLTDASPQLHKSSEKPSLLSKKSIASVLINILIQSLAQFSVFSYLSEQPFYKGKAENIGFFMRTNNLNDQDQSSSVLFVLSSFLLLGIVTAFSEGKPYRKPFYTNFLFLINLIVLWIFNFLIVLLRNNRNVPLKLNTSIPEGFLWKIVLVAHAWILLHILVERIFISAVIKEKKVQT